MTRLKYRPQHRTTLPTALAIYSSGMLLIFLSWAREATVSRHCRGPALPRMGRQEKMLATQLRSWSAWWFKFSIRTPLYCWLGIVPCPAITKGPVCGDMVTADENSILFLLLRYTWKQPCVLEEGVSKASWKRCLATTTLAQAGSSPALRQVLVHGGLSQEQCFPEACPLGMCPSVHPALPLPLDPLGPPVLQTAAGIAECCQQHCQHPATLAATEGPHPCSLTC